MRKFLHEIDGKVKLAMSEETGVVVGRAEYAASENQYFVRYRAADGRQIEAWWGESAVAPA